MTPAQQNEAWQRYALALIAGFILVYLLTLGIRPLFRQDEFRYAEIAREMLSSGDWVSPRLDGFRYFEKPVFGHWFYAASLWIFGENNFAARLPTALSTGLTALFVFIFVRRSTGVAMTGLLAAFIYLTMFLVFTIGTINILDSILTLFITLSLGFFYWGYIENTPKRKTGYLILSGACCGLAFLTKGFLAFVLPISILLPFILWQRRWSELFRLAWLPVISAIAVALPWSLLIHQREPDFWHYFFWVEHIQRFLSDDAPHTRPFWFFLATLPLLIFPWIFLLPNALSGLRKNNSDSRLISYLLFWFIMPFLFFSASRGKLLPYVLPCMPPLAILIALGLKQQYSDRIDGNGVRLSTAALMLTYSAGFTYLLANGLGAAGRPIFHDTETIRWMIATGAFGAGALFNALLLLQKNNQRSIWGAGISVVILFLTIPFIIPDSQRNRLMPEEFFLQQSHLISPNTILVSNGAYIRSVAWTFKRDDIYLINPGELKYGASYPEAKDRLLDVNRLAEFAGKNDIVIFCPDEHTRQKIFELIDPEKRIEIRSGEYFNIIYLPES